MLTLNNWPYRKAVDYPRLGYPPSMLACSNEVVGLLIARLEGPIWGRLWPRSIGMRLHGSRVAEEVRDEFE